MKKNIVIVFGFLFILSSCQNNSNVKRQNALDIIKNAYSIDMYLKFGNLDTNYIYKQFLILENNTSLKELESLIFDKNPNVSCYSFLAYRNKGGNIFPMLKLKINDTNTVFVHYSSITKKNTVGTFCYYSIRKFNPAKNIDTMYLNKKQIDTLNDMILNDCSNKELKELIKRESY